MEPGAIVKIGDNKFEVVSPIGEGTFGVVWGARSEVGVVAIKEIFCRSRSAVSDAVFECQVLHALQGAWSEADAPSIGRVPSFLSCAADCLGPEEWRVRLAMTKIPGDSLNRFLDRRRQQLAKAPCRPQEQFACACFYARELLRQLAPAFGRISTLAYHRDVNPRNILVEDMAERPCYGLIDFGLAVEAAGWRVGAMQTVGGEAAVGGWQILGVGGDCRYWPVSAWLMLEQGPRALSSRPSLCLEYKTHLDLHALGITALQVFAELAPYLASDDGSVADSEEEAAPETLSALCAAWDRYWAEASHYWQRLYDAYRKSGDQQDLATVKAEYRELEVHKRIGEHLSDLRSALRDVIEACDTSWGQDMKGFLPLFHTLLVMISNGEDLARSSWRRVELLIERGVSQI